MKKLLFLFIATILLSSCQKEAKTAFVKTETIFKEYKGSKEQEEIFKKQEEAYTKKYDTLVQQLKNEYYVFQQNANKMSRKDAEQKNNELYQKQMIIQQMQQQESAQIAAEMQKKTDSVIKKVYDFFEEYGKKNGYKYIYGKNSTGALMYGDAQNDITDDVLKALDEAYEAEKK